MSDLSTNLSLPFLLASQSQKHVTFNELVNCIDALLMLSVINNTQTTPPTTPEDGQRYIIASAATGEWSGKDNYIATYQNLGWNYISPQNGFLAFVESEGKFYNYNEAWELLAGTSEQSDTFTKLGIGTSADSVNLFAAKLNNAMFSAKYIDESGDGNIRLKLNKESTSNTASFIFQNNWSGRAEFGLLGSDSFGLKTSSNGSTWNTGFSLDPSSNIMSFYNPVNFPALIDGSNIINKIGGSNFFHLTRGSGTTGKNLFIGLNTASNPHMDTQVYEGSFNVGLGDFTLHNISTGYFNTMIGYQAGYGVTSGFSNIGIGSATLYNNTTGTFNTAIGKGSLYNNIGGLANTAIGVEALILNTSGGANVGIGCWALEANTTGSNNVALGNNSLRYKVDGTDNSNYSNSCGVGYDSRVSASYQVQLGGSSTTTYAFGSVQDRSDERDKADIRDTVLGLDFINALHPVDFKWDMRDDYHVVDEETGEIVHLEKDGSKKRNRYHHGLIAQEVKAVLDAQGVDFGGYQDHSVNGGSDVRSIGYAELIGPLIKAVQELSTRVQAMNTKLTQLGIE